jgi:hypothetical protein
MAGDRCIARAVPGLLRFNCRIYFAELEAPPSVCTQKLFSDGPDAKLAGVAPADSRGPRVRRRDHYCQGVDVVPVWDAKVNTRI